jgi:hypothetical protein
MEIRADARIPFSREIVFAAYRDEIKDLLPYLPNVRGIDVKSRKDNGPIAEFVNEWKGGGDVPGALRAVLSESVLSWTDYATWNADDLVCDWRTETHAFTDAILCRGRNTFIDDGVDRTLLEIRGNLDIDPKKIRGVPGFLAGKVAKSIEEFLVGKIQSNLVETAKGLSKYLEERHRTKG